MKPKLRAAIQARVDPASTPATRFGAVEHTFCKWKHRDSLHNRSHTAHRLQTILTPTQEAVAVVLHKTLLVWPDDLLFMVRDCLGIQHDNKH